MIAQGLRTPRRLLLPALLLASLAACDRTPEPAAVEPDNYVEPVAEVPETAPEPAAPEPEPAPPPVTAAVDAPPPPDPVAPDDQMLEDAEATGMTARVAREEDAAAAAAANAADTGAEVEQK